MRLQGDALRSALDVIVKRWPQEDRALWAQDDAVIACDGHLVVAVPRACVVGDVPPIPAKRAEHIARWLALPQINPAQLSASSLLAFADVKAFYDPCQLCKATGFVTCTNCYGSGELQCECRECGHRHDAECAECEDGLMNCPDCNGREPRHGSLLSAVLNTVLLADILRIVVDERDIAVSLEQLQPKRADRGYVFRPIGDGPQWVALLMPMAAHVEATCAYKP